MEEILCKDIFNDNLLLKLSPDYDPNALVQRMQVRRSLVKSNHCFRINKGNHQPRKNSNNRSTNAKCNIEVAKLKSKFKSKNLKNELHMKDIREVATRTNRKFRDIEIIDDVEIPNTEMMKCDDSDKDNEEFNKTKDSESDKECEIDTLLNKQNPNASTLQTLIIKMALTETKDIHSNEEFKIENASEEICKDSGIAENSTKSSETCSISSKSIEEITSGMSFLSIVQCREQLDDRTKFLLNKYTKKWIEYTKNKKDKLAKERQMAIENFFKKLEEKGHSENNNGDKKAQDNVRDYKTYQHRYKFQKHIIALQKAKLEEQTRIIDDLKYNRIVEASKQSVDAMKEEVRKTYYEMDRSLRPKIKNLTNELNIPEIQEPQLILHCLKVPQFLQRMEKRAREREEKHAVIRERKKQMEEERIRIKQQNELAKLEMDKEEKMRHLKEMKEKRLKEKMESIRRKEFAERMRSLTVMADLHYERNILRRLGVEPLKKLIEIKRNNINIAKSFYQNFLLKRTFFTWLWRTHDIVIERNFIAEDFYRKKILRRVFGVMKLLHHETVLKRQTAEDFSDYYCIKSAFSNYREAVLISKREEQLKMQKAEAYYNSHIKFKVFTCWTTLPALNKLQRERELRKSRWREKVLQVVPDYLPPED